jgi:CRP/FNR family transcriptional regulator, cyclic AMP receptor protein
VRIHSGEKTIAELGASDFFGELAVLDPEPRSASATATSAAHLFRVDHATFYEVVYEHADVAAAVIRVLCRRVRHNQRLALAAD